jgi:predicted ester cyclase
MMGKIVSIRSFTAMFYHPAMHSQEALERNKSIVIRFNREVIEQGNEDAFRELIAADFVNRTAAPGMPNGPEGMLHTFNRVLRPALPDLTVTIHEQVAEGDKVTTRKTLSGTLRGPLLGVAATNERIQIEVIDIVRIENGRYAEHWGINNLPSVLAMLRGSG